MKRFYALATAIVMTVSSLSSLNIVKAADEQLVNKAYYTYDYTDDKGYTHTVFEDDFERATVDDNIWQTHEITLNADPKGSGRKNAVRFSGTDSWLRSGYSTTGKKLITENYSTGELERVRIKADMLFSGAGANFSIAGYNAYSGKTVSLITFNPSNKVFYAFDKASQKSWQDGSWYSITLYLDLDSNIGTVKVNGSVIARDVSLGSAWYSQDRARRIDSLWFALGNQTAGSAYLDNVEYALYPPDLLAEEANGSGIIEYTYCPDVLGGENAYLLTALRADGKLKDVSLNEISPAPLTAAEVKKTAAASGAAYATNMTDAQIKAHLPQHISLRYKKGKNEELCVYLWNKSDLKPLLGGDRRIDAAEEITTEVLEAAKAKWRRHIVGNVANDTDDSLIKKVIEKTDKDARTALSKLNRGDNRESLFENLAIQTTADMTQSYVYLAYMAKAYGTYGSEYYKSAQLKRDITDSLEYLYENYYGYNEINGNPWRDTSLYNWWDWCVGTPIQLGTVLLILEKEIPEEDVEKYLAPYDYLAAKLMTATDIQTIASKSEAGTLVALLKNDGAAIKSYMFDMCKILTRNGMEPHTDGLRDDWNFVLHKNFPYAGGYGVSIIMERLVLVWNIFSGTEYAAANFDDDTFLQMLKNTFEPIVYGGKTMSAFMGRRGGTTESGNGASLIAKSLNLLGKFGEEDDMYIKHFIKRNVSASNLQSVVSKLNMGEAILLSGILEDSSVSDENDYEKLKLYPTGDRIVWQKDGFAAAIAMSSNRVGNYESINGNNTKGWYTADGAVYLYTDSEDGNYGDAYWNNVNPYHIAGTTADTQQREALSIKNPYFSNQHFVGAAELDGKYATAAMALESYHRSTAENVTDDGYGGAQPLHNSTLTAKKSYFIFDNEIVCMGSGICANDGFDVHTVLENRLMSDSSKKIYINGEDTGQAAFEKTAQNVTAVSADGVGGWYFPSGTDLSLKKTSGTTGFFEAWINHGKNPQNSSYAYVILPKMTKAQTSAYAKNPDIQILANGTYVQAVRDNVKNVTGMVFWKAYTFGGITASEPLILMKSETANSVKLSFCDPTAKLNAASVTLPYKSSIKSSDERITAQTTADGGTKLNIDFSNANGNTFYCEFVK